jgi:pimeloyl-ACP methyl ester carboxylesterase
MPLLLIHSVGGDAASDFEFLLPMLSRHRLTMSVELPVLPGNPRTSTLLEVYRASINAVLEAELTPASQVAVAGVGLGGTIAINYAVMNPRVQQVILITSWATPSRSMILHARMIRRLIIKDPTAVDEYLLLSVHGDKFLAALGVEQFDRESRDPYHRRLFQQSQLMEVLDTSDQLADLSIPCLIIAAANDRLVPASSSTALAASLPSSVAAWIATAHGAIAERPAEVLALMDDFLLNPDDHLPGTTVAAHHP